MGWWTKILHMIPVLLTGYEAGKTIQEREQDKQKPIEVTIEREDETNIHILIEIGLGLLILGGVMLIIVRKLIKIATKQRNQENQI